MSTYLINLDHDKKRATSSWINTTSPSFKSTR